MVQVILDSLLSLLLDGLFSCFVRWSWICL